MGLDVFDETYIVALHFIYNPFKEHLQQFYSSDQHLHTFFAWYLNNCVRWPATTGAQLKSRTPFGFLIIPNIPFVFNTTASSFCHQGLLQGEQGLDPPRSKFRVSVLFSQHTSAQFALITFSEKVCLSSQVSAPTAAANRSASGLTKTVSAWKVLWLNASYQAPELRRPCDAAKTAHPSMQYLQKELMFFFSALI